MIQTEYMKEWMKTILYMNVLLLIMDSLLQKTRYESYFRFFSGFLLMLCLLKPFIDLAGADRYMDASYIQNQLRSQWEIIARAGELRQMENDIRTEYDRAIQKQIAVLAVSFFITVTEVEVEWKTGEKTMDGLEIEGKKLEETSEHQPETDDFKETLAEYYHLDSSAIRVKIRE